MNPKIATKVRAWLAEYGERPFRVADIVDAIDERPPGVRAVVYRLTQEGEITVYEAGGGSNRATHYLRAGAKPPSHGAQDALSQMVRRAMAVKKPSEISD